MNPSKKASLSVRTGVGLIALSTVLFEVCLTRIFAVTLWYYFGFLAISLALLGMSVAAVLCFIDPRRFSEKKSVEHLAKFALAYAVLAPVAVFIHVHLDLAGRTSADVMFYLMLGFQLLVLFLAFFAAGMCITIALFQYRKEINTVYCFDLVGASLGSLCIVPLLYKFSPLALTFLISSLASLGGWLFAKPLRRPEMRTALGACIFIAFTLFLVNDRGGLLKIATVKSYSASNLQEFEADKVFEKWSPVSRVAVFRPQLYGKSEAMKVTNDAGAPTLLYRFDGDYSKLDMIKQDSRQVVHLLKSDADTLIIGSGGGSDVLAALRSNQKKITAVEINPVIAELVTKRYAHYIGGIFDDPKVTLRVQEGRNFVAGSKEKYDIIQITMIDSWTGAAAGAYIFNENTLYTREAVRDYMSHMKENGILSITRYFPWDEALRLAHTMVEYLSENGIGDIHERLLVVLEKPRMYRRATVLLKNGRFTPLEASTILAVAQENGYSVVYAPYLRVEDMEKGDASTIFRLLIQPESSNSRSREEMVSAYPRNIRPATDDKPFFFFMVYFRDIFRPNPSDHAARRMALPILYGMFGAFGLLGFLMIVLPLCLSKEASLRSTPYRLRLLVYFALLGTGYMLIELSLIQRLTVFLGHPTYSFVVVLTSLLMASGLGSFQSEWLSVPDHPEKLAGVLACITIAGLLYVLAIYDAFTKLMWLEKPLRIALAVLTITPLGFLMGMCFPGGMQIAQNIQGRLVPWGWGVNGIFSVFASIASLVLALNLGLKATLLAGALCYAAAFVIIRTVQKVRRKE